MAALIRHPVSALGSGVNYSVTEMCFGESGPVVLIQAGLHADECPPLLVAARLTDRLAQLEASGALRAVIRVITQANPIGGSQWLRGHHVGRIDLSSGRNFNREMPGLASQTLKELERRLSDDPAQNRETARTLWQEALSGYVVESPVDALQVVLQSRAVDASLVLDLHSDDEAEPHLYAFDASQEAACDLGRRLGASTVLLDSPSEDASFDDAVVAFWAELDAAYPDAGFQHPVCAMTVELRGTRDVNESLAAHDSNAIIEFLTARGLIAGQAPDVSGDIQVHPLSGMDPITSPDSGLLLWQTALGATFEAGTLIAELYRPDRPSAPCLGIRARVGGRLIAKRGHPWVRSGDVVAKVSGDTPLAWRTEHLLGGRG